MITETGRAGKTRGDKHKYERDKEREEDDWWRWERRA
jgi:hypothetical protein